MKEPTAREERRGWVASIVKSRDPISKEITAETTLFGFFSSEEDALAAAEAEIAAPPRQEPTPYAPGKGDTPAEEPKPARRTATKSTKKGD